MVGLVRLVRYWVVLPRFFYPIPDRQCLSGAAPPRHLYSEHPSELGKGSYSRCIL